jgi:hypothetical protein
MKSKHYGVRSDIDREFDMRYRDKEGKLLWGRLTEDLSKVQSISPQEMFRICYERKKRHPDSAA